MSLIVTAARKLLVFANLIVIRYDMVDLNDYLKLNSNVIVDLEERKGVPAEMTKESTFEGLAKILQGIFIVRRGSDVGKRDQAEIGQKYSNDQP